MTIGAQARTKSKCGGNDKNSIFLYKNSHRHESAVLMIRRSPWFAPRPHQQAHHGRNSSYIKCRPSIRSYRRRLKLWLELQHDPAVAPSDCLRCYRQGNGPQVAQSGITQLRTRSHPVEELTGSLARRYRSPRRCDSAVADTTPELAELMGNFALERVLDAGGEITSCHGSESRFPGGIVVNPVPSCVCHMPHTRLKADY